MERLNRQAARAALRQAASAVTDVTGFGLAGHALGMARASGVGMRIRFTDLPVHAGFYDLVERGVTTGCTRGNLAHVSGFLDDRVGLDKSRTELLVDPQTSGGLLIAVPGAKAAPLLAEILASGHRAAAIGEVVAGPPRLEIV
jgi:selenide,water dikinase